MTLLFGEEATAVGHNQAKVAYAGLVNSGKINLIEDAMAQREPDPAVQVQGGANPGFGARCPARLNPGPARGNARFVF